MKKIMLSGLLLVFIMLANAQTKRDSLLISNGLSKDLLGNNEIKFNFFMAIAGLVEISYERIIHDEHAVGVSLFTAAFENTNLKFGAFPYYRYYFGTRKANGFFLEGSAAILRYGYSSGKANYYIDAAGNSYAVTKPNEMVFGLGAAAGIKFLTRKGFTGEIYLGAGRSINSDRIDIYPRAGLILGKRF